MKYFMVLVLLSSFVYAQVVVNGARPINRNVVERCDDDGCARTIYSYNIFFPDLSRPNITIEDCDGRCIKYGNYLLNISNTINFDFRGLKADYKLTLNGDSQLPVNDAMPMIGDDWVYLNNFFGAGTGFNITFYPDIFVNKLILTRPGYYEYTQHIKNAISLGNMIISGNGETIRFLYPEAYTDNGDIVLYPYFHNTILQVGRDLLIVSQLDFSFRAQSVTIYDPFEYNYSTFMQDTYIDEFNNVTDYSAQAQLIVEGGNSIFDSIGNLEKTAFVAWNMSAFNNETHIFQATNANITFRFVHSAVAGSRPGTIKFTIMDRNWTDSDVTWKNVSNACLDIRLCAWNITGAQGQGQDGLYKASFNNSYPDYSRFYNGDLGYSWSDVSETVTLWNNNIYFINTINKMLNESIASLNRGFRLSGHYDFVNGDTIKVYIQSSEAANIDQRPKLTVYGNYVPRICTCPINGNFIINTYCELKDYQCSIPSNIISIGSNGYLNCTRCNFTASNYLFERGGARAEWDVYSEFG